MKDIKASCAKHSLGSGAPLAQRMPSFFYKPVQGHCVFSILTVVILNSGPTDEYDPDDGVAGEHSYSAVPRDATNGEILGPQSCKPS